MPHRSQNAKSQAGRLSRKWNRNLKHLIAWAKNHIPLILAGWYIYGLLVNSIQLGVSSTFHSPDAPEVESIWVLNPIKNFLAVFTPTGVGVTFFLIVMVCLFTKKGYSWLSGYKFERDPRGFDILPDGTHGTSGWWNKREEIEQLINIGPPDNLEGTLIGKHVDLKFPNEEPEYFAIKSDLRLNRHVMIYGASGTGKSRGFILPFIYAAAKRKGDQRESLVIVDPKGELFERTSEHLRRQGYLIKAYNLLDLENSDGFNCMSVVGNDSSLIATIAEVIIKNTSNANERQDFWEKAEKNLLMALLHYVNNKVDPSTGELLPIEQRSLGEVYNILSQSSFREIDEMFAQLPKKHPATAPYNVFKLAGHQIWGNVAIGLGNRLAVFQNPLVDKITRYDDIDLLQLGQRPCAYYCIISAQDSSLEFLSSMFFSLMFTCLPNYARKHCPNGRLPVAVHAVLEEACNIGHLVDFPRTISFTRGFNLHCILAIQGVAQISDRYPGREWEEIIGNCDVQLFLGANDKMTADYWSSKIGMASIRTTTNQIPMQPLFSPVYNTTRPYSQTRTTTQRPLMYPDELLRLDNDQEIVLIRGQKPLLLHKINPDDLPGFSKMPRTRVVDYIPRWRKLEEQETVHEEPAAAATDHDEPAAVSGRQYRAPSSPRRPAQTGAYIPPWAASEAPSELPPSDRSVPAQKAGEDSPPQPPAAKAPKPAVPEPESPPAPAILTRYTYSYISTEDIKDASAQDQ